MNHRSQSGSRSAGIVHLHTQVAQTVIDDRLRAAGEYRRGRALTTQDEPNERRGLLARIARGKGAKAIERGAFRPTTAGRGRVRPEEGQS